jgi:DNA-binding transcriptional MerR regulator
MRKLLTIGEVAKLLHLSTSQIRFYERKNLIAPHTVDSNGYRLYSFKEIDTLEYIVLFRQIGLSVSEIKEIMNQKEGYNLTELLDRTLQQLNEEISELKAKVTSLEHLKSESIAHLDNEPKIISYPKRQLYVLDEDISLERPEKELYDLVQKYQLDYRFHNQQFLSVSNNNKIMQCIQSPYENMQLSQLQTFELDEGEYFTWNKKVDKYKDTEDAFQLLLQTCKKAGYTPEGACIAIEDVTTFLSSHNQISLTLQTKIK